MDKQPLFDSIAEEGEFASKVDISFGPDKAIVNHSTAGIGSVMTSVYLFLLLLFVLPSISFSDVGAEWNPTGNPIGGGPGYSDTVRHQDADFYVSTKEQLLSAVSNASYGDIIYVADTAEINMTGTERIFIPGHVTLASGRGRILGDTISWGGLLYTNDKSDASLDFLMMGGNGVRITGLRIRGPYWYRQGFNSVDTFSLSNSSYGVQAWRDSLIVDNCEFWGWSHSCVYSATSKGFYVHHNYFYEGQNCCLGMGGCTGSSGDGIWEANLFDFVRHNIASSGDTAQSWEARYNIGLEHSANHNLDRHGWPSDGGYAGKRTIIHHNTCRSYGNPTQSTSGGQSVRIRGLPVQACSIYNNWFFPSDSATAIKLWSGNTNTWIFDNHFGVNLPSGLSSRMPVAVVGVDTDSGTVPLSASFSSSGSYDPDGNIAWYEWDFGDNAQTVRRPNATYTFNDIGIYNVELTIHDNDGIPAYERRRIIAGPANDSFYISLWVNDRCHSADTGFFFKQVLVNGNLIWEDDVAGCEGWVHVVENITNIVGSMDSVIVKLRLYCKKDYSSSTMPEVQTFWDDVSLFWGELKNGDFESSGDWNYYETQAYFQGQYDREDARSGTQCYNLFFWRENDCVQGNYGQISQTVAMGDLGISYSSDEPSSFRLFYSYPNPAHQESRMHYVLSKSCRVLLDIYDVGGRLVKSIINQQQGPGEYNLIWDGKDALDRQVPGGVYLCRFAADNCVDTKQIVWVR